jgi:hypothetical protein
VSSTSPELTGLSATSPELTCPRSSPGRRLVQTVRSCPVPVAAFLASRLIVLLAGVAGALVIPRRNDWTVFDPAHFSDRLGSLGNVLGAVAVRWDSIHYLTIAEHGYARATDTVFFPLYPLLIRAGGYLLGSTALAGAVVSSAAFTVALVVLHRLAALELGARAADATVLLLAFAPLSFFFSAVYTESLFLALSVGCLYAARRGRWRLSVALGPLGAVTRVTGIVLVLPLVILRIADRRGPDRGLVWVLSLPAAFAAYLAFVAAKGFGPLAPFLQETAKQYRRSMTGPPGTVVAALHAALSGLRTFGSTPAYAPSLGGPFSPGAESILLLGVLVLAAVALVAVFRRLPLAYGAYAAGALLVCISSPVAGQPLKSVDRYTLTIFPLWMAAAAWLSERRLTARTIVLSAGMLAFFAFQFATWAFIA